MTKNEINELINTYENKGLTELIAKLYDIQDKQKLKELSDMLVAYMHLTNEKNHSYFYTSQSEQIVTNNTNSIIYFNKRLFDFKNINNRKIVRKQSFSIYRNEILDMINILKERCGNSTKTNNINILDDVVTVSTKEKSVDYPKQDFELISKLLNGSSFELSDDTSYLYIEGDNGYAYILGKQKETSEKI